MTNSAPVCADRLFTARSIGSSMPLLGSLDAEAHVHDARVVGGPLHAVDDPRLLAEAVVAEHLADDQVGARGDALLDAAGGRAGAGDRRGDVGAVAVVVLGVLTRHEAGRAVDLAGQVGVSGVDAGVEHGDRGAAAVVPGGPRLRCVHLCDALGQVRLHLAVEVDLRDPGGEDRLRRYDVGRRDRVPEGGGGLLGRAERRAVDAGEHRRPGGPGGCRGLARVDAVLVPDDHGYGVGVRVVVPVGDQRGDVEEPAVQPVGGEVGQGLLGQDVEVLAHGLGADGAGGALRPLDRDGALASADVRNGDHVTGDQGYPMRYGGRCRSCAGRLFGRRCARATGGGGCRLAGRHQADGQTGRGEGGERRLGGSG